MHEITLTELVHWAGMFVLVSSIVRTVLPPKELVWQYYPNTKWYGLVCDVIVRWSALDLRTQVWDIEKHKAEYERSKRETKTGSDSSVGG